jgi:hypothetical protein
MCDLGKCLCCDAVRERSFSVAILASRGEHPVLNQNTSRQFRGYADVDRRVWLSNARLIEQPTSCGSQDRAVLP